MLSKNILIVGGYGAVGGVIADRLARKFPGQVIVAGRNYEKVEAFAKASEGNLRPYQLDLATAHKNPGLLNDVAIVVMCVDVPDMRFVKQCLEQGIHYIDMTADDKILRQIELLADMAKEGGSTAVLSVGVAPGLTNLLASHVQTKFDTVNRLDIHVFLGLGEAHGSAAAHWTLQNLNADYLVCEDGEWRQVTSFGDHKSAQFPNGLGQRRVYRFNIADQHVISRTLNMPSVSTWVTFDPAFFTMLMTFLRRTGLSKLLHYQWIEDMVVKFSTGVQYGTEKFAVQVEAQGEKGGRHQIQTVAVTGNGQSRATGLVTAQVVEQLLSEDFPPGIFHSEQLFEPLPFIHRLTTDNITYHENGNRNEIIP